MDENNIVNTTPIASSNSMNNSTSQIAGAIIVAGIIIAGAIMLKGSGTGVATTPNGQVPTVKIAPVTAADHSIGSDSAKVVLIEYADFQCPFCERFFTDSESVIKTNYVATGKVKFVYRDFAFLGPESTSAAEAARCAADQGKFWEYHDYLFTHQNGENKGGFADANLKTFAKAVGLDETTFNGCLDTGKYTKAVTDSAAEGKVAGVSGTPKGFILKNGKVVSTIDGAEPVATITAKLDAALK